LADLLRLVARKGMRYFKFMKTLTVQEASQDLGNLLRCAASGEEIAIRDGGCTVLLQPVSASSKTPLRGREALRQLQSQSRLTPVQAESYLREVHAERPAHGNGDRK
jgi:antitoxin (DNA-binding transcriptional repressor) of toxin-antitoxin stability system